MESDNAGDDESLIACQLSTCRNSTRERLGAYARTEKVRFYRKIWRGYVIQDHRERRYRALVSRYRTYSRYRIYLRSSHVQAALTLHAVHKQQQQQ